MPTSALNRSAHPITDAGYRQECRRRLAADGALVLKAFFTDEAVRTIVSDAAGREGEAFFASSSHNVYLTDPDDRLADDHPFNRQVLSTKGLIADDQIPADSPLRSVYSDPEFQGFLCAVLSVDALYPYDDELSSINIHFAPHGKELGWHFDNSSFAVTMLLQAPEAGGRFEYVPNARQTRGGESGSGESGSRESGSREEGFEAVGRVLDGDSPVQTLSFNPGDLVLFRGRESLHRVTPTVGSTTRLLVVFAYNDRPGVRLSDSALETFYGRTG